MADIKLVGQYNLNVNRRLTSGGEEEAGLGLNSQCHRCTFQANVLPMSYTSPDTDWFQG